MGKFFEWHNAYSKPYSRQYMSAILFHNQRQQDVVRSVLARIERESGEIVKTEVAAFRGMTLAEDYHQKYYLRRNREVAREFKALYPELLDFTNSTAVMRVNAHLGNRLSLSAEDLATFGLSAEAQSSLLEPKKKGLLGFLSR